ncbi:hypothetical protein RHSIM_Rhsim03G0235400 [Rhododendron simsii]|uniref:C3H1-type domain-containing protein n=1 Tax=Rhododendron simsii TaxID=118357 RepID=A0A834H7L7_RHOSS|nr:hypothetical protein RHSIM_Rhsim03G0235400 [Rhododendron simsii]
MMIGEPNRHPNPTVHVPPWTFLDDPTAVDTSFPFPVTGISVNTNNNADELFSPLDALSALNQYLPSNEPDYDSDGSGFDSDLYQNLFCCDQFRMYEFKIKKCTRARSHDWTECPFAHPGEKARRRDPRKSHYSGVACPDFRKGTCKKGDACEYAHGVFECWLHPSRYRTQPCKDGSNCRRRVCFFAHSPDQLRVLSPGSGHVESYDGSPHRLAMESSCGRVGSCLSPESPPVSDSLSRSLGSNSLSVMVRRLQLNKVKSMPSSWGVQMGSPRFALTRPVFSSLPTTPTNRIGSFDHFEKVGSGSEEEPVMERVESGKGLRAKMFEKLSRENPLDRVDPAPASWGPDVGWVSELVK